ncbi:MAG: glycosyltransferase [Spirosomataceae bacterium]
MKVIYLTTESYYREPIIKSQVETLLLELITMGVPVELVTFEYSKSKFTDENGYKHYQFKHINHFSNMLMLIYYTFKISKKGDILHVRSYPPMLAAITVKLLFGNKVIFDPRGLWPEEMSYFKKKYIVTFTFKKLEIIFCYLADSIVLVSNNFLSLFQKRYPKQSRKMIVVPTFSIPLIISSNVRKIKRDIFSNENVEIFVYSGSFEKWQKISEIVSYFCFLEENYPNSRFLFLSKSKKMFDDYLKNKLKPENYTVISATYSDLGSILVQCDYGVIFRDKHIINQVSAPIKVKDYLTANLSVIATDNIGDSSELIKNNNLGFILEDFSLSSKVKSLSYIQSNCGKRKETSKTRCDLLEEFSISNVSNKYQKIYNTLK